MPTWSGPVVAISAATLVACGSAAGTPPAPTRAHGATSVDSAQESDPRGAGAVDTAPGLDPASDHGAPSETYPAFTPDVGQLVDNKGGFLQKPVIVTVTWPNESNADAYENFGDRIGSSAYWQAAVGEYGVGPASSGASNHVRIKTAPPASFTTDELDRFVATSASAAHRAASSWPAPTGQSIYTLYLPVGTKLDMGGGQDACAIRVGGYHQSTQIDGQEIAYAVIPQCTSNSLDASTRSASHEIGETATDPHPSLDAGWTGFDDNHWAWELFQDRQTENGDMCEFYKDSYYQNTEPNFPFQVQRLWSNKSASAGHAPCTPAPSGAYFNVTPLALANVTLDMSDLGGSAKQSTRGYHVAVGDTRTIPLGFYSDAPETAWSLEAVEGSPFGKPPATPKLSLSLDRTRGRNGEKAH